MKREEQFLAVSALGDVARWDLYRFVRRQSHPVTREEAARALRISVKLAAFHLDKLVDRGLLRADHEVPDGARRRVGRAPKRYSPSDAEVSLSVPERHYQLVGEILVDTLAQDDAGKAGESTVERARRIAWGRGERLGAEVSEARRPGRLGPERTVAAAEDLLEKHGYEPVDDDDGGLILRNCPFHALVDRAPFWSVPSTPRSLTACCGASVTTACVPISSLRRDCAVSACVYRDAHRPRCPLWTHSKNPYERTTDNSHMAV